VFHCLQADANGGETLLVDGFQVSMCVAVFVAVCVAVCVALFVALCVAVLA